MLPAIANVPAVADGHVEVDITGTGLFAAPVVLKDDAKCLTAGYQWGGDAFAQSTFNLDCNRQLIKPGVKSAATLRVNAVYTIGETVDAQQVLFAEKGNYVHVRVRPNGTTDWENIIAGTLLDVSLPQPAQGVLTWFLFVSGEVTSAAGA